ncbi:hypothetical protein AAFF_G00217340 [Aldrovandia affinis]|uniref:SH3 domain-binding glutamic acid-rich-like protein n=1 Tax=Aldrovandia affinis TaxID=143900 RepID=A0AAD7SVX1_9TELE|nr:hypothetical protein AAFF_G00217340 [Aldrovandia affinis]
MSITIYYTSVSGSRELKGHQNKIFQYLDSKNIEYKMVDISQSSEVKDEMRRKADNPRALPPQIFSGDVYCGDYDKFFEALEEEKIDAFLKL